MKKSISAILVAALMLFAFTACEQQMPTYKVPTGLTISTTKTAYLVGETLDASAFSGVVRYSDGSSDTLSGADLSLSLPAQNGKIVENANKVTATYGAVNASGKANSVSASTTVYGYYVTSMTLGNLPETVAQSVSGGDADQPISTEGVTATVVYNGQTRELAAGEFTIGSLTIDTQTPTAEGADGTDIDVADVKVFGTTVQPEDIVTGKAVVTEYVSDPVFTEADIVSIAVGYLDEDDEFTTSGNVYINDKIADSGLVVQATDKNGVKHVFASTESSKYTIEVANASGEFDAVGKVNVIATLAADTTIKSPAFSVDVKDYVTGIVAAMVDGKTIDPGTVSTSSALSSLVKVTATYASNTSEKPVTRDLNFDEYSFSCGVFTDQSSVTVTYTGKEGKAGAAAITATLTPSFTTAG